MMHGRLLGVSSLANRSQRTCFTSKLAPTVDILAGSRLPR